MVGLRLLLKIECFFMLTKGYTLTQTHTHKHTHTYNNLKEERKGERME